MSKEDQIKPVNEEEAQQITERFKEMSLMIQVGANILQRQAAINLGTLGLLSGKSMNLSSVNLTNGLGARVLYQCLGVYPALVVRKHLTDQENVSSFTVSMASCSAETFLGGPLEVLGSQKTLKALGVHIPNKQLASLSCKVFLPIYFRNYLTWLAINENCDNSMISKTIYGAFAGFSTTPLQNISVQTMASGAGKSWKETANDVIEIFKNKPSLLLKGAAVRAASIAATSVFLAPETTERIRDVCVKIASLYQEQSKCQKQQNSPPTSTKAGAASNIALGANEREK